MNTTNTGRAAEEAAAEYLVRCGYVIRERNWRNRWCEIDIVAEKANRLYFVEVKYRATGAQGSGLDYITPKKLRQMRFAAGVYSADTKWQDEVSLAAIEVASPQNTVTEFIDSIGLDY